MKWLWAAALLFACGDDSFTDLPQSGSRVRVEWYRGEDGSLTPTGRLYDRQLQRFCYPYAWDDGSARCSDLDGYLAFADPACTQPVIVGGDTTQIAAEFAPTSCAPSAAYTPGSAIATQTYFQRNGDGSCSAAITTTDPVWTAVPFPADTFATMALAAPRGDGRLRFVDRTTSDGSRVLDHVEDSELHVACSPQSGTCEPVATSEIDYLDAACTKPVAAVYVGACAPEIAYAQVPDATCAERARYFALADAVTPVPTQLYVRTGTTCSSTVPSNDFVYRALGAEITPVSLARAREAQGAHRLQRVYDVGGGIAAASYELYDAQLATSCSWQTASDGVTRCLPDAVGYNAYYSDPSCTVSVQIAFVASAACASEPAPQFAVRFSAPGNEIHELVGAHTGMVYQRSGTTCEVVVAAGQDAYDVDPRIVDPTSFAASELVLTP